MHNICLFLTHMHQLDGLSGKNSTNRVPCWNSMSMSDWSLVFLQFLNWLPKLEASTNTACHMGSYLKLGICEQKTCLFSKDFFSDSLLTHTHTHPSCTSLVSSSVTLYFFPTSFIIHWVKIISCNNFFFVTLHSFQFKWETKEKRNKKN